MLADMAKQIIDGLPVDEDVRDGLTLLIYEQELLYMSLRGLVWHWREFGPDYGFDELVDEAADRHGIT